MSNDLSPEQIALPPQTELEIRQLIEIDVSRESFYFPSEVIHQIIQHTDLQNQIAFRAVGTIWRDTINERRNWRFLDLTFLNGMRIHERLLDRLYPIWPTDRFGPPPVVELILPARSPLRDDQPHFDMFIRVHRRYFRIISFGFEMCDNGRLILTYLPDMTELRTLHLEGANALLPLSNPADERIIDPVWASSSGLPGRLDLPPRLEELRIVTVGIPLASSGWTLTGSLVRLDLECAVRPVRGTGNQLDLEILTNLSATLRVLRLTRCRVEGLPVQLVGGTVVGPLDHFLSLEVLELIDCDWDARTLLPPNLETLRVEVPTRGSIRNASVHDWAVSQLPSLQHVTIMGMPYLDVAFLRNLLVHNQQNAAHPGLRTLEMGWNLLQTIQYNNSFPVLQLRDILVRHGRTLESLTINARGLPTAAVYYILQNCPALTSLTLSGRAIGWASVDQIVRHVQQTGMGLRRLVVIHWDAVNSTPQIRALLALMDQLGIEHEITRSASPM